MNKGKIIAITVVIVLLMTIGFAAFSTNLKTTGTTNLEKNTINDIDDEDEEKEEKEELIPIETKKDKEDNKKEDNYLVYFDETRTFNNTNNNLNNNVNTNTSTNNNTNNNNGTSNSNENNDNENTNTNVDVLANKIVAVNGDGTNLGDIVEYDDQQYFVLFSDQDTVTLMPKFNLKLENNVFTQDPTDIGFSSTNDFVFDEANNREDEDCDSPGGGCNKYAKDEVTSKDSTIKGYVDQYKQQLIESEMIEETDDVRLISLDELGQLGYDVSDRSHPIHAINDAPYFLYTSTYWTGEAREGSVWDIWFVLKEGELSYNWAVGTEIGLRPIIQVSKDRIGFDTNGKYTFAVWMWDTDFNEIITSEETMDESAQFLKSMKVNEVYASVVPDDLFLEPTRIFISKLNAAGIKVYVLYGDPIFVMPSRYSNVINYNMQSVKDFNDYYLGFAHIEGIHYDVEYHGTKYDDVHTCPDGESEEAKNCVARRYFVQFVKTAYAKAHQLHLKVQYDITPFNSQFTSYYEENGDGPYNLLDSIIDYGDDFVFMSYGNGTRNSTEPLFKKGTVAQAGNTTITVEKNIVEKFEEKNKNIIVGQELEVFKNTAEELATEPSLGPIYLPEYEENGHTVYVYNKEFVTRVFNDIIDAVHENGGTKASIAVHDYRWFKDLFDN